MVMQPVEKLKQKLMTDKLKLKIRMD